MMTLFLYYCSDIDSVYEIGVERCYMRDVGSTIVFFPVSLCLVCFHNFFVIFFHGKGRFRVTESVTYVE